MEKEKSIKKDVIPVSNNSIKNKTSNYSSSKYKINQENHRTSHPESENILEEINKNVKKHNNLILTLNCIIICILIGLSCWLMF